MMVTGESREEPQPVNPHETAPTVNVSARLTQMAGDRPFQRAVVVPAGRDSRGNRTYSHLTFRQLERESDCVARGLTERGIQRGTRTILMVRPGLEFFVLIFSLFKIGAVPVVVDPGMGVRRMLSCLAESKAAAMIGIAPAHLLRLVYPRFFKTVRLKVSVGSFPGLWGAASFDRVRKTPWQPYAAAATEAEETAAILFTTGSTGPAKGAVYTHGIFDAQVRHIRSRFDIQPGEIDLPTFPLFALFDPALGMTAVIPEMDPTKPARVNPENIIGPILQHGVTNMFASPALLNRVGRFGREKNVRLPTLKRVISAGAPALPDNLEQFSAMLPEGAQIYPGYGATEAMPVAVMGSREILSSTRRLSEQGYGICVGRSIPGVDVRIIRISDDSIQHWSDDLELPPGNIGEIAVRGDVVTRRYFERTRDDLLSKIVDNDAVWHRMGDLGWVDKEKRLWFCGRKSHRVITEKGTLYTVPCEAIFNNHPDVFRSALVGVGPKPHQKPVMCVELEKTVKAGRKKTIQEELAVLAQASVITKDIRTILFHRSFPVDIRHNSKIFRERLAEWAEKRLASRSFQRQRFQRRQA